MNRNNRNGHNQTESMQKSVRECAHRHLFHAMPPQGWMNDPNGFVYFSGRYHLFYQYNPFAPKWDLMHWGHCQSDDLIHWSHLPPALVPDRRYDASGCYSGSSIVHDGRLYMFYTGVDTAGRQTQCLAVSDDGRKFCKHKNNPLIPRPPGTVNPKQFRDPCVFKHGKQFYMIVGAESKDRRGQAIVYKSADLLDWAYLNTITAGDDPLGYMWECPNLFFLDGRAILILSPQGIKGKPLFNNSHDSGYFIGSFNGDTGAYTHGEFRKLDMGFDFYAPQTAAVAGGRHILMAWMSTWATPAPTAACGWAGSMALPRDVRLKDGKLLFHTVPEALRFMKPVITVEDVRSGALLPLQASAGRLEIVSEHKDFTVFLFCSADGQEYTSLSYRAETRSLCLDLSRSGEAARGTRSVTLRQTEDLHLDVYLDRSSVEVFLNEGDQVMTARVFPHRESDGIRFAGSAVFHSFSLWEFAADLKNE